MAPIKRPNIAVERDALQMGFALTLCVPLLEL